MGCAGFFEDDVGAEERGIGGLVEAAGREREDGLGGVFLAGREAVAVELEEEDSDDEAGAFVAIDERMVCDDAGCVRGGEIDYVRCLSVGGEMAGARQGGLQQAGATQFLGSAVKRSGGRAARLRRVRRSSAAPSPGEGAQGVPVARDDVFGLGQLVFESGVVGREAVAAVRSFDEEERISVFGLETADDLFGQDDTEGAAEAGDFELDHQGTFCNYDCSNMGAREQEGEDQRGRREQVRYCFAQGFRIDCFVRARGRAGV